jgi:hypothetical protein
VEQRRPQDLTDDELGSRSRHIVALYGGETLSITDLRGEAGDPLASAEVQIMNLVLKGRLQVLEALGTGLATVSLAAMSEPGRWDEIPGRKRRAGGRIILESPFRATLGRPDIDSP